MEREQLVQLWQEAWTDGLWYTPWGKALEDLTPQQAAWKPAAARHSIWQILNHIMFWQDYTLRSARGQKPDRETFAREQEQRNWEEPGETTDDSWSLTKRNFQDSYTQMVALAHSAEKLDRALYHLMHESYHFGQIMYLRAMQGLPAIE
jgi:hypothetical protein